MPQRDYLLRLLEQAIEAILQAAKFRREGQPERALHSVVFTMERLFGLTIGDFSSLSVDEIYGQLTREEHPVEARDKCLVFAALNHEAGLCYEEREQRALAQPAFYLSLVFTLRAWRDFPRDDVPSFTPKIGDLLFRLEGFDLPSEVRELADQRQRASAL